ncbi:MAG: CRISPR-associated endonuclease Cas6 [Ignavibacteriaceae bacterium]|nr:CRISPR-associated endonuclease Cas6 [Ignavibacteriaceae bacterium]
MKKIDISIFHSPGVNLKTRDAVKLRGYIGNLFRDYSPLLHNHFDDGSFRYAYPLVQYKVINGQPYIVAVEEGAELLRSLFFSIKEIDIDGRRIRLTEKYIGSDMKYIGADDTLWTYDFITSWMALNDKNFKEYLNLDHHMAREDFLKKILTGNILSFFKYMGHHEENKILITASLRGDRANFKDRTMLTFTGTFTTNVLLPSFIGLGKAVSRGFGVIKQQGVESVLNY